MGEGVGRGGGVGDAWRDVEKGMEGVREAWSDVDWIKEMGEWGGRWRGSRGWGRSGRTWRRGWVQEETSGYLLSGQMRRYLEIKLKLSNAITRIQISNDMQQTKTDITSEGPEQL